MCGDMSEDADAWAEAREGYLEVRAVMADMTKVLQKSTTVGEKQNNIRDMLDAYQTAKSSLVGSQVHCPTCGKLHTKTTYHKVFCSNGRTKRGGNCKDVYWNSVDEKRAERANAYLLLNNR
jgi:hypothetical protein